MNYFQIKKKMFTIYLIFTLVTISFFIIFSSDFMILDVKSEPGLIYVGGTETGHFSTIQAAVDSANSGDTIFIHSGTYYENVEIDKCVSLIGEDMYKTIISGGGTEDHCINFNNCDDQSLIKRLTLTNGDAGVNILSSKVILEDLYIYNCEFGVENWRNSHTKILDCNISTRHFDGVFATGTILEIINTTFYSIHRDCIMFNSADCEAYVINCSFGGNTRHINLKAGTHDVVLINTSTEPSKNKIKEYTHSIIEVQYYINVNVVDQIEKPIPYVLVEIFDAKNNLVANDTTDSEGVTRNMRCTSFIQNSSTIDSSMNNYMIKATLGEHLVNRNLFVNQTKSINVTLVLGNIAPRIETDDVKIAMVGVDYNVKYTAFDFNGDELFWNETDNASWLKWDAVNQRLYGSPERSDIGRYLVTIKVSDINKTYDQHEFILIVTKFNHPPEITGAPAYLNFTSLVNTHFNMTSYISDKDNAHSDLFLQVEADFVYDDGLVLYFYDMFPGFTDEVTITVSDGINVSNSHVMIVYFNITDVISPTILESSPDGLEVPITDAITVTFSEPMYHSSVETSIRIIPNTEVNFSWVHNTVILTPDQELLRGKIYEIIIYESAMDLAGNPLRESSSWSFTTQHKIPPDADSDGMLDTWEILYGLDSTRHDGYEDNDDDGLLNINEFEEETDPTNPDTDGDGFNDGVEVENKTDPLDDESYPKKSKKNNVSEDDNKYLLIYIIVLIVFFIVLLLMLVMKSKNSETNMEDTDRRISKIENQPSAKQSTGYYPPSELQPIKNSQYQQHYCSKCNQNLSYIDNMNKYYCYRCQRYE